MKRISSLSIVLLLILCAFTEARDYYVPLRYRTQWSPYTHSLVSGFVEYNPYALKYQSSGMVSRDLDYNPYAFGYNKSGLVPFQSPGYGGTSVLNIVHSGNVSAEQCINNYKSSDYAKKISEKRASDRKAKIEKQKAQLEKNKQQKANDPSEAIREFLKTKNIRFRTNRYLRINGETVSVNFIIEDANMIIKFWNSKVISEFEENDKHKKNIFENYLKSWEEYCLNKIGNSKEIFNIISGSREELLEQLSLYENLKSDDILYASGQDQSSTLINQ